MCILGQKYFAALKQSIVVLDLSKLEISPQRLILASPATSAAHDDAVYILQV